MLANHSHERLLALRLIGMAKAFDDQLRQPDIDKLSFEQRLGLMIDREVTERDNRRLVTRLKFASLRQTAVIEDIDLRASRGIDRSFLAKLVDGDWIGRKQNLLITGATGTGKSWIACALAHKACRDNRSVLYHRLPRLFEALALARGDGRYARLLKALSRVDLLILDDWGIAREAANPESIITGGGYGFRVPRFARARNDDLDRAAIAPLARDPERREDPYVNTRQAGPQFETMALRPRKLPIGYYVYTITVDDVVLGWTEGRNTRIDLRWAADDVELMQRFAKELVAQQPDSLSDYSGSLPSARAERWPSSLVVI